jgi:hypothetical protein
VQSENSHCQTRDVAERVALLREANDGKLDGLTCPRCVKPCVSAWFTHPQEREYRTWFICNNCDFEMRAQNTGRPLHYSKQRDRTATEVAESPRQMAADRRG